MNNHREVMETARGVELDVFHGASAGDWLIIGYSASMLSATVHMSADEAEQFAQLILRGVEAARKQREAA